MQKRKNPITAEQNTDGSFSFKGRSLSPTRDKNEALAPYGKMVWNHGQKLLLLPTEEQAEAIRRIIGCARFVRNHYLDTRIRLFREEAAPLNGSAYKKEYLPKLKEEHPWLKDADKFALEAAIEHVDDAYRNFFNGKARFPRFVSRYRPSGNRYETKYTNGNIRLFTSGDGLAYVQIPKVGKVRCVMPKGMTPKGILSNNGRILKAAVSKDGRDYLVSLSLEHVVDKAEPLHTVRPDRVIAMDMGLRRFCDYSADGKTFVRVENPKWILKHEKRLRRFQKALSRKQYDTAAHKGSANWEKARQKVAGEHRKIANQRKDFHHKLSRTVADSCDVFVCEDLNIRGMLKDRRLAKAVSSVGWYRFPTFVRYKLERKGGVFLKVSRWFPSSKLCACGYKNTDLKRGDRYWTCPKCHAVHDRDDNAVVNLRREGIRLLSEKGMTVA